MLLAAPGAFRPSGIVDRPDLSGRKTILEIQEGEAL